MVEYELWFVTKFPCGCVIAEYIGTAFVVEEFPQDLVGHLIDRGDLSSDEVEPEVEGPEFEVGDEKSEVEDLDEEPDIEFSEETLNRYLDGLFDKEGVEAVEELEEDEFSDLDFDEADE